MSLPSAVIDALIASGCTAEQLGAAMKAANAADEARKESKRANNAERQRRYRERHSNENNALQDVTACDSVTAPALSLPPNENNSNPPTHTHPDINTTREEPIFHVEAWKRFKRPKGKHLLPAGWKPAQFGIGTKSRAMVDGWPPGEAELQLEHFTAHHRKNDTKFTDWQAAWSTWVLNGRRFGNGRSQTPRSANPPTQRDGFSRTLDRVIFDDRAGEPARTLGQPDDAGAARLLSFTPAARATG